MNRLICLSIYVAIAALAPEARACSGGGLSVRFGFERHPDLPYEKYASGQLGVVLPTWARAHLVVAFRALEGRPLAPAEQAAAARLWERRSTRVGPASPEDQQKAWIAARATVSGVAAPPAIQPWRHLPSYVGYLSCPDDAFRTAVRTLGERRRQQTEADVRAWVAAQDQVFAGCGEDRPPPALLPADASPLARADRAYQIAAAHFYGRRFDEARAAFSAIGKDKRSPWRAMGPYLAARAEVRKLSLSEKPDAELAARVGKRLEGLAGERAGGAIAQAAARLGALVEVRYRTALRARALGERLARSGKDTDSFEAALDDYTFALDRVLGEDPSKLPDAALRSDALTDWIVTMQASDAPATARALSRWKETKSAAWLVAAIGKVAPGHADAAALVAAADALPAAHPSRVTAAYHAARLAPGEDGARRRLDALLAGTLPLSARNRALALRLPLARTLAELVKDAVRTPVGLVFDDDPGERPEDLSRTTDGVAKAYLAAPARLDADAARVLGEGLPLARQLEAIRLLPPHLAGELRRAAFVRALLLDRADVARSLAAELERQEPALAPYLAPYRAATDAGGRLFAAAVALLHLPGLRPRLDGGMGRQSAIAERDEYRDNGWCAAPPEQPAGPTLVALSAAERRAAADDGAAITKLGPGPNALGRMVLAWAAAHADDPRVPEALHQVVRATRFWCTDAETTRVSRDAFRALHVRYPQSEWTKKTPFHY